MTVKAYAKRYGVDRYTAYEDLLAVGFPVSTKDSQWAVRPPPTPPAAKPEVEEPSPLDGIELFYYGDEVMFVVGYTSNGFPYGPVKHIDDPEPW